MPGAAFGRLLLTCVYYEFVVQFDGIFINLEAWSVKMPATEVIQLRVTPSLKSELEDRCRLQGTSVSEKLRSLVQKELSREQTPLERADAIFAEADERVQAAGLPEPDIAEIAAFCERVKQERAAAIARMS